MLYSQSEDGLDGWRDGKFYLFGKFIDIGLELFTFLLLILFP